MKKTLLAAAICCTTLLGSASAEAYTSTNGSTGLINTPNANIVEDFSLGFYDINNGQRYLLGIGLSENLELGVAGYEWDGRRDDSVQLNLKYALAGEKILTPGIAVGLEDITDEDDRTAYIVASKGLVGGVRAHIGLGNGRYDGLFAGIEVGLTNGFILPKTVLVAEHDGSDFNYGLRIGLTEDLKVHVGERNDHTYVGVTLTR